MKKALVLAATVAVLASPSIAQQSAPPVTGQETGAGLGLGGVTPATAGAILAGVVVLGAIIASGGDDGGSGSTTTTTTTTTE